MSLPTVTIVHQPLGFTMEVFEHAAAGFLAVNPQWKRAANDPAGPAVQPVHFQAFAAMRKERDSWKEEAEMRGRDIAQLRAELDLRRLQQARDVWFWMGDGEDHLESMGSTMAVQISARQLRALVGSRWRLLSDVPEKSDRYIVAHAGQIGGSAFFTANAGDTSFPIGWSQMPDFSPTHWLDGPRVGFAA